MTNNDILRRIRYTFDFSDSKMIALFALAEYQVTRAQVSDWLKKEEDPAYQKLNDTQLAIFLNGLIIDKRGKKEGPPPQPEKRLTNNIIFMKLKIALTLKAENILEILALVDLRISSHELSAFFRRPDHKHYRACNDQILRNFLKGMQIKYRDALQEKIATIKKKVSCNNRPKLKIATIEKPVEIDNRQKRRYVTPKGQK